jgi:hypothetical protein
MPGVLSLTFAVWSGAVTTKPQDPNYNETAGYTSTKSAIPAGYSEVGCIAEGKTGRALLAASFTSANMTRGAVSMTTA